MQTVSIRLAIGGDKGNTVNKYNITPAEVAVLMLIHGEDAVSEVRPVGEVTRTHRAERQRLAGIYKNKYVDALFPGAAARVFERLEELDLPEEFFAAVERVSAGKAEPEPESGQQEPAAVLTAAQKRAATKAKKIAAEKAAAAAAVSEGKEAEAEEENDGIEDMDDNDSVLD